MLTLIHGDDTAASRNYFLSEKQKYKDVSSFDGEKVTLTDLVQVFEGGNLFIEEKTVFIENFLLRKASKEREELLTYLLSQKNASIFLWEGKELTPKDTTFFKTAAIKLFKIPQSLFLFLDELRPSNEKLSLYFHKALQTSPEDLLLFMLIRQFRILLALTDKSAEIDEVKRISPWQRGKLEKQLSFFTQEKLLESYNKLFTIDLQNKTSHTALTLTQAIDFFLVSL